jgi:hypothetical protein
MIEIYDVLSYSNRIISNVKRKVAPPPEARDAQISFKIPASMKRALESATRADKRSISSMAMVILEAGLKEKGFLK